LEQRRQEQQEEEKRRQYLAHLARNQRKQQLREERIKHQKAAALEELKRKEEMRRRLNLVNQTIEPQSRIIRGPDGNLYRDLFDSPPTNPKYDKCNHSQSKKADVTTDHNDGKSRHDFISTTKMDCLDDITVDQSNTSKSVKNTKQEYKRKKIVPKKIIKSSILVGDVEDASDSECEDEFSDYMHTRRPQPGQWMEPIEYMTS